MNYVNTFGKNFKKLSKNHSEIQELSQKISEELLSLIENKKISSQLEEEVKILDIDEAQILKKLKQYGIEKNFSGLVYDVKIKLNKIKPNFKNFYKDDKGNEYYLKDGKIFFKKENFEEIEVDFGKTFRLRQKGNNFYFTIKSKDLGKNGVKIKVEFTKKILDLKDFLIFFEKFLGISLKDKNYNLVDFSMENLKKIFLENYGLTLKEERKKHRKEFKFLGTKITIDKYDGIPIFMEIEGNQEKIEEVKIKLGILNKQTVNYGYKELLKHYGK